MDPKKGDNLEALLRSWGADEAAGSVNVPEMPQLARRRSFARTLVFKALPAGLAAGLLIGLALHYKPWETRRAQEPAAPGRDGMVAKATYDADLKALRDALAEKDRQLANTQQALRQATDNLNTATTQVLALEQRISNSDVAKLTDDLAKARDELAAARQLRDAYKQELDACAKANREMTDKMALLEASHKKLATELAALKKGESTRLMWMLLTAQRAYLGGKPTLAARKSAVTANRLTCRVAEVKPKVPPLVRGQAELPADAAKREAALLVDQLEVALTLLDLLDVTDAEKVSGFRKLIEQNNFIARIDEVMLTPGADAELAMWLFEVKLVLLGVGGEA